MIIADFMSEANMVIGAARKVDQLQAPSTRDAATQESMAAAMPGYEPSFLLALEPALEDLARHGIKLAVNAGNSDTEGLYKVVMQIIQAKGLKLKVSKYDLLVPEDIR